MPKTNHHTLSLSSIFFLLLLCSFPTLHAQQLAVKTNGLMLAAMAPNIGCEFVVGDGAVSTSRLSAQSTSMATKPNDRSSARIPLLV